MAIFSHYGTGQRVGFALVMIGFCLCFSGSIAPYWITAKTTVNDIKLLDEIDSLANLDDTLYELNIGVWYYCVTFIEEKCFGVYDTNDFKAWINLVRSFVVFTNILSCVSGLAACCRCLCCSGGRTILHGILCLLAGVLGIAAFVIFYKHSESVLNIPTSNIHLDWAYSIFGVGSIIIAIASLPLCFGIPRQVAFGMVYAPQAATTSGVSVNVTNSNISQYNAGGHVQAFEPLPNATTLQNMAAGPHPGQCYPSNYYPAAGQA